MPAAEAESRAHDVARKIASQSTVAAQAIKESVLSTFENASLRAAVDHEHERFRACFASADQREGMRRSLRRETRMEAQIISND